MTDTNEDRLEKIKKQGLYALDFENYCWLIEKVEHLMARNRGWMEESTLYLEQIDSLTKENAELKLANKAFADGAVKTWKPTVQERQLVIELLRNENAELKQKLAEAEGKLENG